MNPERVARELGDRDLAEALMSQFKANELRRWMSANGLERSRGANKRESAMQAVQQDPVGIAEWLMDRNALDLSGFDRRCRYYEACGNLTDSPNADMCNSCLDAARANDRARDPLDPADFPSRAAYMAEARRRYL